MKATQPEWDVIVAGAGPAGLFAALQAAKKGRSVLALEKQPQAGRKLLLTGSGQCNFTHDGPILDFIDAYGDHGRWLKPALFHFTNRDAVAFFRRHGVESATVKETGKIFPESRKARDILDALLGACRDEGVEIKLRQGVSQIRRSEGTGFRVASNGESYAAGSVVIATGGKSYPATGSTGDGYALARSLGHAIVPPRPGLTPFFIRDFSLADLAGTSFKRMEVSLWRRDRKIKTLAGDLVVTHHGISGPVVHNLSRYAVAGDRVTLALVSARQPEAFKQEAWAGMERAGQVKAGAWLKPFRLTQALNRKLLNLAGIRPEEAVGQLHRAKRQTLLRLLLEFPLTIAGLGGFDVAMVTCGGVCLDEVNPKTMESRLVPGLYFAGEVLDIDGDSGGYDLQAAWSTAALVSARWT
ncbi:MAG: NAD(P)/FAD-dependent oxidoreductase [candidate division FCPU426 bacterium]